MSAFTIRSPFLEVMTFTEHHLRLLKQNTGKRVGKQTIQFGVISFIYTELRINAYCFEWQNQKISRLSPEIHFWKGFPVKWESKLNETEVKSSSYCWRTTFTKPIHFLLSILSYTTVLKSVGLFTWVYILFLTEETSWRWVVLLFSQQNCNYSCLDKYKST